MRKTEKAVSKQFSTVTSFFKDLFVATVAGLVVGFAYFFFQNSNGFAPGGVGGLATITHYLLSDFVDWSVLMLTFNLPIFVLLSIFVNRRLGFILAVYMVVQSFTPDLLLALGASPYCKAVSGEDFNVIFACIATGVISGFGFSIMLRHFGASGGTYGISALLRLKKPDLNVAAVSFIMDSSVVLIAFFVYGMKVTPVICTLLNLFIANIIVDNGINGLKNGYKFEIVTSNPRELSAELMEKLKHGVTQIQIHGAYSDTDKYMLICIINKRQIGDMMRILKAHEEVFASFEKVNEVFGNFKRRV